MENIIIFYNKVRKNIFNFHNKFIYNKLLYILF